MLEQDIYHIISAHLKGSASAEEQKKLMQWMDQSPENKQLFQEMEKVWNLTGNLSRNIEVDANHEWNRFVKLREQEKNTANLFPKSRLLSHWYWKVAAVLLPVLVLTSVLFYLNPFSDSVNWITLETNDTTKQFRLDDGTRVWVNKNSKLLYPEKFKGNERLVKLSGEAFFEVSKNGTPFKVETEKAVVKVLGTKFNLRCYKAGGSAELFVKEGKVLFTSKKDTAINSILTRGELAILADSSGSVIKETVPNDQLLAWLNQRLTFENTPMQQVGKTLERYFQKKIVVSPSLNDCLITGDFNRPELQETLDIICTTIGCTFKEEAGTLIFSGKGCSR